jgi:hypothetical protein
MDGSPSTRMSLDAIMYIIHHIFLPSKLPQEDDFNPQHESILLDTTSHALQMFKAAVGYGQQGIIESVIATINNLRIVRDDSGFINEGELQSALRKLPKNGMFFS